eukprot:1142040-Pelagomonas_calceolata.AAC.2
MPSGSNRSSTDGRCLLCDDMDSINHIVLRCANPTMSGMHTNRHHVGHSLYVEALSKGRFGSSLIGMDACCNERLLDQGIQVTGNISRAIADWFSLMVLAPLPGTKVALIKLEC